MKIVLFFLLLNTLVSDCQSQRLFPYRKDTFWGYCDSLKNIIIKPHYDYVYEFDNDSKQGIVRKGNYIGIVNERDSILFPFSSDIINYFNDNYLVKKEGKWGLINKKFKKILPFLYSDIIKLNNGKYFAIKHSISRKAKFYDSRVILKKESNRIVSQFKDGSIVITYPDKKYIPQKINYIFNNGNFAVHAGEDPSLLKIGLYINRENFHDTSYEFTPEVFCWEYSTYNKYGQRLSRCTKRRYNYMGSNRFSSYNAETFANNLYDDNFKKINSDSLNFCEPFRFFNNYLRIQRNGYSYVFDTNGLLVVRFKGNIHQDILANKFWGQLNWNSRWGMYDFKNQLLIDSVYDYVSFYDKTKNRIVVGKNKKRGMIDTSGRIIVPFIYSHLLNFHEGLAEAAFNDSSCGFIDTSNKIVIPFDYCINYSLFNEGLAEVKKRNSGVYNYGYINRKNEIVIPLIYTSEYDVSYIQDNIGELWVHEYLSKSKNTLHRKFYFHSNGKVFYDP
ncbi:MAG: WG repeat-containing protein [Chitinophagales bacterium]|nr:WG repeat-containing protein [Chitinophagales bacterium]